MSMITVSPMMVLCLALDAEICADLTELPNKEEPTMPDGSYVTRSMQKRKGKVLNWQDRKMGKK